MSEQEGPRGWKRMLRFLPLYVAMRLAGVFAALSPRPRWRPRRRPAWRPGISVIVPERGTPDLLAGTLAALAKAVEGIPEPVQVVVVVNGADAVHYRPLQILYPDWDWHFHTQPLGYNGAIQAGLRHTRHDWVYLLNSDMQLASDALLALLPWRQDGVFALASQLHFADPLRRREETGWSDARIHATHVEMYERTPLAGDCPRGTLYAGGGASLFRSAPLRRFVAASAGYNPFYWEDAEWGARAWAEGWEVLFVPTSNATHLHRGTVNRFHAAGDVERVFARNAMQFELRQHWTELTSRTSLGVIGWLPGASQSELASLRTAWGVLRRRFAARRTRDRGLDFVTRTSRWYPRPFRPGYPRLLMITPFAVSPPSHGGARRVTELARRLSDDYDVILLSDERTAYADVLDPAFASLAAVHLVEGRGDQPGDPPQDLPTRIRRHVHPRLHDELQRLLAIYQPEVVQVEFMELAGLGATRQGDACWVLDLHDVYLDGGTTDAMQRALMANFDVLSACSGEDIAALEGLPSVTVPNGAVDRTRNGLPSQGKDILFMGPFRYAPNRLGIEAFLRGAWPQVRRCVPDATLTILGGRESATLAGTPLYTQPGVDLVTRHRDPGPLLAHCALTINPQMEIRGSAVKVAESLMAARCCVTTTDGARGFTDLSVEGLEIVDDMAGMADAVIRLLQSPQERHRRERPSSTTRQKLGWDGAVHALLAAFRKTHREMH